MILRSMVLHRQLRVELLDDIMLHLKEECPRVVMLQRYDFMCLHLLLSSMVERRELVDRSIFCSGDAFPTHDSLRLHQDFYHNPNDMVTDSDSLLHVAESSIY